MSKMKVALMIKIFGKPLKKIEHWVTYVMVMKTYSNFKYLLRKFFISWVELTSCERNWAIDNPIELSPRSCLVNPIPELSKVPGLKIPAKTYESEIYLLTWIETSRQVTTQIKVSTFISNYYLKQKFNSQ